MEFVTETNRVPRKASYDVIVAGGGVAGIAAALQARRMGKSVLVVEKSITLGGLATLGLINLFVPMCNGRGTQIIGGLAEELLRLSIRYGYDTVPDEWRNGQPGPGAKTRYVTRFSASIFAMTLMEQITDEGIDLLLDSVVSQPVMEGNLCRGLILENKSGRTFYEAGIVIDTTGDADVLFRAGVPTVQGLNYFTYCAQSITLESCRKAVEAQNIERAYVPVSGGPATLYGTYQPEGMKRFEGTTAEEVTEFIVKNQRVLMEKLKKEDRNTREIVTLPGMAQFRTTRHIDGEYTLTTDDCYRHFEDSISTICDFDHKDFLYEVPLRTLCRTEFPNLITAGRSAAAKGYAWDVLRVIPPAIATGQAAGMTAAMALETGLPIAKTPILPLQNALEKAGLMIHFADSLIPATPSAPEKGPDIGHI